MLRRTAASSSITSTWLGESLVVIVFTPSIPTAATAWHSCQGRDLQHTTATEHATQSAFGAADGHRLAKKSISNFRLREGMKVGLKVTLRGVRMYEFLDRLVSLAIPRVKDFRGLNPNAFDGRGNYNMGLTEQTLFPEVNPDKVSFTQGMNIAFTTTAANDEEAQRLLALLGMPFRPVEK